MPNVTFRAPEDVVDDLDERAEDQDQTRTDVILSCIREALYDDDDAEQDKVSQLQEQVSELREELEETRRERDELRGELRAVQNELEDLRGYRDRMSAELARAPAIEGVDEETGEVVVSDESESDGGSGWWPW